MEVDDALTPVLPKGFLIDAVSRLSAKDACRLKVLSKSWHSLISYNSEFKRLHRLRARQRPSLLLLVQPIRHSPSAGMFCEPCSGDMGLGLGLGHTLVFKFRSSSENLGESVASCRDLMLFHDSKVIYIYSPSTYQYLRFENWVTQLKPIQYRMGLVYIASMNLYKIVKLEVYGSPPLSPATVRFEALTVQEEEDKPQGGGGGQCDGDEHRASSLWEFIIEHAMHSSVSVNLGNLIGVNGVVYAIINISDVEQGQVLSLGFEELDHKQDSFKIFSLPKGACEEGNCHGCTMHNKLYQMKDLLCFPHTTTSSIDLWLLKDRNACTWFKGHTISYIPQPHHHKIWNLFCCPQPTTTFSDDADNGAGLFLFRFGDRLFVYDMHSKEFRNRCVEKYQHGEEFHVFTDSLYSLKNGLRCTRGPFDGKTVVPHMWLMDDSLTSSDDSWKMDNQLIPDVSDNEDSKSSMEMDDVLRSRLPLMLLIDVVSRLSAKEACKLKSLSKSWLSLLRAPQMPPLLVLSKVVADESRPRLFIEEQEEGSTALEEDFGVRKVNFNFYFKMEREAEKISSCRDLMCFHDNNNVICVYSPSTNQYLRLKTWVPHGLAEDTRIGIVYVASMKLYKIVKLEASRDSNCTLRFDAATVVHDEEYGSQFRGGRGDTCSWEVISEHSMHSPMFGLLGNLIGVDGVAYAIIGLLASVRRLLVVSLGEDNSFKMFSIPQAARDDNNKSLFQVKDRLCFPHITESAVDLWLLKDGNTCPNWFKGYSIRYIESDYTSLEGLAYFPPPHPTTTISDDAVPDTGVILFMVGGKLFRYDISTKEVKYFSQDKSMPVIHAFSNLYPLKNGLNCPHMPAPPERSRKEMVPPEPKRKVMVLPRLPPPSAYIEEALKHIEEALKRKRTEPLLNLPPPTRRLISLPPPPRRFNPHDFKYGTDLPEAKNRKVILQ